MTAFKCLNIKYLNFNSYYPPAMICSVKVFTSALVLMVSQNRISRRLIEINKRKSDYFETKNA